MGFLNRVEKISFERLEELPGIEVIRIDHSLKCMRVFPQAYIITTNLNNGDHQTFGKAHYRGRVHTATNNDTVICEPGEIMDVKYLSRPGCSRNLFISPETLKKTALELGIPGPGLHFNLHVTNHPTLYQAFKNLHQSLETPSSALERQSRWAHCSHLLLEVAAEKTPPPSPKGADKKAVQRAVDFLNEHCTMDISLESLAAAARLSPFHFLRVFKRETGLPPHAYQIQLRLAKARKLLQRRISPSQAATDSGFFDQSHLIRHFKKSMLVTPTQYAKARS